jgi:hypothetical protein
VPNQSPSLRRRDLIFGRCYFTTLHAGGNICSDCVGITANNRITGHFCNEIMIRVDEMIRPRCKGGDASICLIVIVFYGDIIIVVRVVASCSILCM